MNGFRQSGHQGCKLKKLILDICNYRALVNPPKDASLALIAGLRDGIFPNLEELLTPHGGWLTSEVAELVEVLRGGAPCARTLRTVILGAERGSVDLTALQTALPQPWIGFES